MRLIVAFLAAFTATAAAATAQQTPENAHLFLSTVIAQGATKARIDHGRGWNIVRQEVYQCSWQQVSSGGLFGSPTYRLLCNNFVRDENFSAPDYQARSYKNTSICDGQLEAIAPMFDLLASRGNQELRRSNLPSGTFSINWRNVSKIARSGTALTLEGNNPRVMIVFSSEDFATRAAFAMEVLRIRCDPTAGTGF